MNRKKVLFLVLLLVSVLSLSAFLVGCADKNPPAEEDFLTASGYAVAGAAAKQDGDELITQENEIVFADIISVKDGYAYGVYKDSFGMISAGDKVEMDGADGYVFYVIIEKDGKSLTRKLIISQTQVFVVSYDLDGGAGSEESFRDIAVSNGGRITEPQEKPTKEYCTFLGWDFDFNTPVTSSFTVTALWKYDEAKYTVKVLLSDDGYSYSEDTSRREEKQGLITKTVSMDPPKIPNYVFVRDESKLSGVVAADGSLVLEAKYMKPLFASEITVNGKSVKTDWLKQDDPTGYYYYYDSENGTLSDYTKDYSTAKDENKEAPVDTLVYADSAKKVDSMIFADRPLRNNVMFRFAADVTDGSNAEGQKAGFALTDGDNFLYVRTSYGSFQIYYGSVGGKMEQANKKNSAVGTLHCGLGDKYVYTEGEHQGENRNYPNKLYFQVFIDKENKEISVFYKKDGEPEYTECIILTPNGAKKPDGTVLSMYNEANETICSILNAEQVACGFGTNNQICKTVFGEISVKNTAESDYAKYTTKVLISEDGVNYTENTNYTNEHKGLISKIVTMDPPVIDGYAVNNRSKLSGVVKADGSLVIEAKYVKALFKKNITVNGNTVENKYLDYADAADSAKKYGKYEYDAETNALTDVTTKNVDGWTKSSDLIFADKVLSGGIVFEFFADVSKSTSATGQEVGFALTDGTNYLYVATWWNSFSIFYGTSDMTRCKEGTGSSLHCGLGKNHKSTYPNKLYFRVVVDKTAREIVVFYSESENGEYKDCFVLKEDGAYKVSGEKISAFDNAADTVKKILDAEQLACGFGTSNQDCNNVFGDISIENLTESDYADYTVETYTCDNDNCTLTNTEPKRGLIGRTVNVVPDEKDGYVVSDGDSTLSGVVTADGELTLVVKYVRSLFTSSVTVNGTTLKTERLKINDTTDGYYQYNIADNTLTDKTPYNVDSGDSGNTSTMIFANTKITDKGVFEFSVDVSAADGKKGTSDGTQGEIATQRAGFALTDGTNYLYVRVSYTRYQAFYNSGTSMKSYTSDNAGNFHPGLGDKYVYASGDHKGEDRNFANKLWFRVTIDKTAKEITVYFATEKGGEYTKSLMITPSGATGYQIDQNGSAMSINAVSGANTAVGNILSANEILCGFGTNSAGNANNKLQCNTVFGDISIENVTSL